MQPGPDDPYRGREATQVKHLVLQRYIERLAYTVGFWCKTLNYVEGFAGPWRSVDEQQSDTSPHIALRELDRAREGLAKVGKTPRIRAFFVEENAAAAAALRSSLSSRENVRVHTGRFLKAIPKINEFVDDPSQPGPRFTLYFVDPTGWTGYDPDVMAALLRHDNTEVLINFMTEYIVRFVDSGDEAIRRSFIPLLGSEAEWIRWQGLKGDSRQQSIVDAFCHRLKQIGNFRFVVWTIVLHPKRNRTFFHLIYGTRHIAGLRAFREVERATFGDQSRIRQTARRSDREQRTGQRELFDAGEINEVTYEDSLVERYQTTSRTAVRDQLMTVNSLDFDALEEFALQRPMTSLKDLQRWLSEWQKDGLVRIEGLQPRERVPKTASHHRVIWIGPETSRTEPSPGRA